MISEIIKPKEPPGTKALYNLLFKVKQPDIIPIKREIKTNYLGISMLIILNENSLTLYYY